jgi:hypothetical protein
MKLRPRAEAKVCLFDPAAKQGNAIAEFRARMNAPIRRVGRRNVSARENHPWRHQGGW